MKRYEAGRLSLLRNSRVIFSGQYVSMRVMYSAGELRDGCPVAIGSEARRTS